MPRIRAPTSTAPPSRAARRRSWPRAIASWCRRAWPTGTVTCRASSSAPPCMCRSLSDSDEQKQFREDVMMTKMFLLAALLAFALPAAAQERPAPPKLFASAAEVEGATARAPPRHKGGNTVEVLANVGIYTWQL